MDILEERYILIVIKENNPMKCNVFFSISHHVDQCEKMKISNMIG